MQEIAARTKGLVLKTDIDLDIPHGLLGDQLRIKQILLNLLGNAIKFTSQGSIMLSARLLERHDTCVLVRIEVSDTGVGITSEALDRIFSPFEQEDGSTTRKYGGTGLGLSICRRLTELMGGSISVKSTPGVGSCFTVTLPFSLGTGISTIQELPQKEIVSWGGPPLRILYVEDDKTNIYFGTSLLKKLGHDVTTAENGKKCMAALEQGSFDIVLLDIQMPVMNGEEALLEIRRKEQGTSFHQPVIALTAYSMRGENKRFLEEGFDGYVSKPLVIKELIVEMKRVMDMTEKSLQQIEEEIHE
jgi:CheY-like chemotaxis protein